jgi:hypothetical protein
MKYLKIHYVTHKYHWHAVATIVIAKSENEIDMSKAEL